MLRGGYRTEILRKIWFDRSELRVARLQTFGPKGVLLSDVRVSDWQPLVSDQEHPGGGAAPAVDAFPRAIRIERPHDDYQLDLQIAKVNLNEDIPQERFRLEQPAGSEVVRVGEKPGEARP